MSTPPKPWGFSLVPAAIVVVALLCSVTMFTLRGQIAPSTAIAAMSGDFTEIGTLVNTFFGIKADLDGQDKVKDTVSRARGESEDHLTGPHPQGVGALREAPLP